MIAQVSNSRNITSSRDLLLLMQEQPELFLILQGEDEASCVAAFAISAVLAAGSVTIMFLVPLGEVAGVLVGAALAAGTSGMKNVATSAHFRWEKFLWETVYQAGTTLITFGAGYAAGHFVGIALTTSSTLSGSAIRAFSSVAGSMAGAMTKSTLFVIRRHAENGPVEAVSILLEALSGAITGGIAGYIAGREVVSAFQGEEIVEIAGEEVGIHAFDRPMRAQDVRNCLGDACCENPLIVTGSHGDAAGSSIVEAYANGCGTLFRNLFYGRNINGIADGTRFVLQDLQSVLNHGQGSVFNLMNAIGSICEGSGAAALEDIARKLVESIAAAGHTSVIFAFCHSQQGELLRVFRELCSLQFMISPSSMAGVQTAVVVLNLSRYHRR